MRKESSPQDKKAEKRKKKKEGMVRVCQKYLGAAMNTKQTC
jgi:hypothetical protein